MNSEVEAYHQNKTWIFKFLIELLKSKILICCKCIYKIKYKADGSYRQEKIIEK